MPSGFLVLFPAMPTPTTSSPVLEVFELGMHWPTVDPFLFCAHHHDDYPEATSDLGPDPELLRSRQIGQDFSQIDGWSMYHGAVVPGFPQHPHRGFETVSYLRAGHIDHADSLGATARFGAGDVQWMTAGAGVQHAEMFPLLDRTAPNPLHMFQVWLNLPRRSKMVEPAFRMLWSETIPEIAGSGSVVRVLAGELEGRRAPAPPPDSWAADPDNDVAIWHIELDGGEVVLPPASEGSNRVLYVFDGGPAQLDGAPIGGGQGALVDATVEHRLSAAGPTEILVLQGRPIGEPVAQYGPFVMNETTEVQQAYADFQATGFGGWPWPTPDPNHGSQARRFAIHPDGSRSDPPSPEGDNGARNEQDAGRD